MNKISKPDFELFKNASRSKADFPRATISKLGNINFNKKFLVEYFSEKPEGWHMVFHYNKNSNVIGLQAVSAPTTISNPIRVLENQKGMSVSARAFLDHYGIKYSEKSRSYRIELYKKADSPLFFIIDLNESE
jgi:hypothetical protein